MLYQFGNQCQQCQCPIYPVCPPSGLTPGDYLVATSSSSIGNASVLSESGNNLTANGNINITGNLNANGSTYLNGGLTTNNYTVINDSLRVSPFAPGALSALYVEDPSSNIVFNVRTTGNGQVAVGGVNDTNKFSVDTSTGTMFKVDTLNQQVSIQPPTNTNRAFNIIDNSGNEVFYASTASSGIVIVGGNNSITKFAVYSISGVAIFVVDTATPAISISGGLNLSYLSVSSSTTLTTSNTIVGVTSSATSGAITLTLPQPSSSNTGQVFTIKDVSGNAATYNITVSPTLSYIDGVSSYVINTNYGVARIFSNGVNYYLM